MSQLPTASETTEFERRLVQYYRENCNALIARFRSTGAKSEIRSALHEVLAEIFDRYVHGRPAPDNLGGFVHTAVRRKLIDLIRKESWQEADKVPVEDIDLECDAVAELLNLPVTPENEAAWRELFRTAFDRLPPKWHEVAKMAMLGASPAQIGWHFEQDGYVLRRHARRLICRILRELADAGDELARGLARDFSRGSRPAA